jgi:hypothetical protein
MSIDYSIGNFQILDGSTWGELLLNHTSGFSLYYSIESKDEEDCGTFHKLLLVPNNCVRLSFVLIKHDTKILRDCLFKRIFTPPNESIEKSVQRRDKKIHTTSGGIKKFMIPAPGVINF